MEAFSSMLSKLLEWLIFKLLPNFLYKLAMDMKSYFSTLLLFIKPSNPSLKSSSPPNPTFFPTLNKTHVTNFAVEAPNSKTIVCDINGALLRSSLSSSFFPFFMLVAFEGGSIVRAFLLLVSYPFCCLLSHGPKLRAMIFITFFGMKVEVVKGVGRTVLPKFYIEELNPLVYEMWASAKGKIVITSVPRVMVDWFAREYLEATHVLGTELHTINNNGVFFSGLLANSSRGLLEKKNAIKECFGDIKPDVGIGIQSCIHDHLLLSLCKEAYVVSQDTTTAATTTTKLPRTKHPKPLVFHDGRLAFLPTPLAALSMFLYLPLGLPLGILRLIVGTRPPFPLITLLGSFTGIRLRHSTTTGARLKGHMLYVSNHRTLVDPVLLSIALRKPLTAVTFSLSRLSELIAPIPTVRLTRNRARDASTMQRLLSKGDLIICPEGTTCREPYLLRFSSLFAELTDEIVPVALEADVSMFYGTTASGLKWLDPIFFMMNPSPGYSVRVLRKVPAEMTCGGGGRSGVEVANYVQREVAEALGFECTGFTRKDKYMILAGNEGFVDSSSVAYD